MRKIYALLSVMALTSVTAVAAVPVKTAAMAIAKGDKSAVTQKAPVAKAAPAGEYKSLGMGTYTDDCILPLYSGKPASYQVEIRQSVEDPNFYQVVAPYGTAFADEAIKQMTMTESNYDSTNSKILTLDATDPNNVTFSEFATGCDFGDGEMSIGVIGGYYVTLKDGVFSGTQKGLYVKDSEGMYYANLSGAFQIVLPGVTPKDYTFEPTLKSTCITDGIVSVSMEVGADVAAVKYKMYPNIANESGLVQRTADVAKTGTAIDKSRYAEFTYTMGDNQKETLCLVALDKDGTVLKYVILSYYDMADDADQWEDCGNVTFNLNLFGIYYEGLSAETLTDVPFQRNKTDKGRLRLVNPCTESSYVIAYNRHREAHNHYIVLNVADPEMIYLEESPLGVDFGTGFGMFRLWSYAGYYVRSEQTKEDIIAAGVALPVYDKASNTIQFPANSLITSAMDLNYGRWFKVDCGNNAITFPAGFDVFGGVDDITVDADAGVARYYNLQGVSVANPVAGQLYIRVQGDKAVKVRW